MRGEWLRIPKSNRRLAHGAHGRRAGGFAASRSHSRRNNHDQNLDVQRNKGDNSQLLVPAAGLPAVTVPMGYWQGRLPAGLQFAGRPFAEGALIELAYAYEQKTGYRRPPEGFGVIAE